MPYMDQKVKKMWLDALRSGEYKQCYGRLITKNANHEVFFCATGVLLSLYVHGHYILPEMSIQDPLF
jgi:hypothetical protein